MLKDLKREICSNQTSIINNTTNNNTTTNNTTNNVNIQINNKTITTITPKHNKNETKIEKLNKIDLYKGFTNYSEKITWKELFGLF